MSRITITLHIDTPDGSRVSADPMETDRIEAAGRQIFQDVLEPLPPEPNAAPSVFGQAMRASGFGGQAQPVVQSNGWQAGAVHTAGHKPLKLGRTGKSLYCPTALGKDAQGQTIFCDFKA